MIFQTILIQNNFAMTLKFIFTYCFNQHHNCDGIFSLHIYEHEDINMILKVHIFYVLVEILKFTHEKRRFKLKYIVAALKI